MKDAKTGKKNKRDKYEKFDKRKLDRSQNFAYEGQSGWCLYYKAAVFNVNFNIQTW